MTHQYTAKTFTIPETPGLSKEGIDAHIGLYNGYVANFNAQTTLIETLSQDTKDNTHTLAEILRRRSFEFDGMRLHEYYFSQIEGESAPLVPESPLAIALTAQFGSVEACLAMIKTAANLRGPGWSILYYDPQVGQFHIGFTGEQHQGHFSTLPIIFALDVWEHAYLPDYGTTGKGGYIDAYLANVNWEVVAQRFVPVA
jgi:Fe-Mn family superoxide dismutase